MIDSITGLIDTKNVQSESLFSPFNELYRNPSMFPVSNINITKIAIYISIESKGKKLPETKSKKINEVTSDEISKNENTALYIAFLCALLVFPFDIGTSLVKPLNIPKLP